MPVRTWDSSLITARRRNVAVAGSFISRIQNTLQPNTGYGNTINGNYDNSVITQVKSGSITEFLRNGTCVTQNNGCPCGITNAVQPDEPSPPPPPVLTGWATRIGGTGEDVGYGIATDSMGNTYVTGYYRSNPVTFNSFSSTTGGVIDVSPYGTLSNSGSGDVFIAKYNTNGIVQWATNVSGAIFETGFDISTDSLGNCYITGYYNSNSITINSFSSVSGGVISVTPYGTLSNSGRDDAFIVKYNTNGIAQWATSIGGSANDAAYDISTDSLGNSYITGYYRSNPVTFNSFNSVSGGVISLTPYGTLSNIGGTDPFIVKYNTNGIVQWATNIDGSSSDLGLSISSDSLENTYVTGYYASNPITLNSFNSVGGGVISVTPYGTLSRGSGDDVFIVKYNTNGIVQWATRLGGGSFESGYIIVSDSLGNCYVTGYYQSDPLTINSFNSVSGGVISVTSYGTLSNSSASDDEVFIVKYNTNGIAQWATRIGGTSSDVGFGIATDSLGNTYVTGRYVSDPITIYSFNSVSGGVISVTSYGTLSNSGPSDIFIAKYNINGIAQWATNIGGSSNDTAVDITTDSLGNCYVTGLYISESITINTFDSVSGGVITVTPYGTLSNSGEADAFVVKYDTNGQM